MHSAKYGAVLKNGVTTLTRGRVASGDCTGIDGLDSLVETNCQLAFWKLEAVQIAGGDDPQFTGVTGA